MGFARALKREITATDYLPFLRHADEHTIVTTGRGAFQMLKIEGRVVSHGGHERDQCAA